MPNLTPCANVNQSSSVTGGTQCASGFCTSRDMQCAIRGSDSGLVKACPVFSFSCSIYCSVDAITCVQLSGFFIDGTQCGYNGVCYSGACNQPWCTSNLIQSYRSTLYLDGIAISWLQGHLAASIGLAFVTLVIIMLCVFRCVVVYFNRKDRALAHARNAAFADSLTTLSHQENLNSQNNIPSSQQRLQPVENSSNMRASPSTTGLLAQSASMSLDFSNNSTNMSNNPNRLGNQRPTLRNIPNTPVVVNPIAYPGVSSSSQSNLPSVSSRTNLRDDSGIRSEEWVDPLRYNGYNTHSTPDSQWHQSIFTTPMSIKIYYFMLIPTARFSILHIYF